MKRKRITWPRLPENPDGGDSSVNVATCAYARVRFGDLLHKGTNLVKEIDVVPLLIHMFCERAPEVPKAKRHGLFKSMIHYFVRLIVWKVFTYNTEFASPKYPLRCSLTLIQSYLTILSSMYDDVSPKELLIHALNVRDLYVDDPRQVEMTEKDAMVVMQKKRIAPLTGQRASSSFLTWCVQYLYFAGPHTPIDTQVPPNAPDWIRTLCPKLVFGHLLGVCSEVNLPEVGRICGDSMAKQAFFDNCFMGAMNIRPKDHAFLQERNIWPNRQVGKKVSAYNVGGIPKGRFPDECPLSKYVTFVLAMRHKGLHADGIHCVWSFLRP